MAGLIEGRPFRTKARTVDHLGREQIADCPTAVSELWKNAYDAYARNVALDIYDGNEPVAVIVDDGHGMTPDEFVNRWLVVGAEDKAVAKEPPDEDRHGLRHRERQGQKGIGRLSCANLGPILLLVSKRRKSPFVAALVDWRLFENLFLDLNDIAIPVTQFVDREELFERLPDLSRGLAENVTGNTDKHRSRRVLNAWKASDEMFGRVSDDNVRPSATSDEILSSIRNVVYEARHLKRWPVWAGDSDHGTALLVSRINYDLNVQISKSEDSTSRAARERFSETLSCFVDPFVDPSAPAQKFQDPEFSCVVRVWKGDRSELVVGNKKQFDLNAIRGMEHCIEGSIDASGVFRGRIRAFGEDLPELCVIEPPKDLRLPTTRSTKLGPFGLYIASMEFTRAKTTHTQDDFQKFQRLAKEYAGFMIFRDRLRVLPYGRTDNDFFEIEERRSKNAGREFWNQRQMFGRIAISRSRNPNLKDKAGREGLLDNLAAKTLKVLVSNVLRESARWYFGSEADLRKELLPEIEADNARRRAAEARERLRKRHRQEFKSKLRTHLKDLPTLARGIETEARRLKIETGRQISQAREWLEDSRERLTEFSLPAAPSELGTLAESYASYRKAMQSAEVALRSVNERIDRRLEEIELADPRRLLDDQIQLHRERMRRSVLNWKRRINELQTTEARRIREILDERVRMFEAQSDLLLHRYDVGTLDFIETSKLLDLLRRRMDAENDDIFSPYAGALESLRESIDLQHLAIFGMEELSDLRSELDRLNGLAQLGIAVEIVGHELQSYDDMIGSGLTRLPEHIRTSEAAKDIELGYEGLTDQLRFLSPLRLAGQRVQRWIVGDEIADYLAEFFRFTLARSKIKLEVTKEFRMFRVFDQRSRLYPVFINLVNNSIYWLAVEDRADRRIVLSVVNSEVVVSDNGPGVEPEDVPELFTLFFTRKMRGGRGVGLYLARANLAAGGNRIRYEPPQERMPLSGANFVIEFKGAEFGDELRTVH